MSDTVTLLAMEVIYVKRSKMGLKNKCKGCELFFWWHHWKTTIDNFSIFPKTKSLHWNQNTKDRWIYYSWFIAPPEITSRLIGKETYWTGNSYWNYSKTRCTIWFFGEKLFQSAKVVVFPENQYMFSSSSSLGNPYDKVWQNRRRLAF